MPTLLGFRSLACLFLAVSAGDVVRGQSPELNAIVSINGETTLYCLTSFLPASTWTRTADGETTESLLISVGCTINTNVTVYYRTDQLVGFICRLTITNATKQQAGVYNCADGSGIIYRNLVTVIDLVASLIVYNASEIVENDQLNISCSINYNGPVSPAPLLRPLPSWTTSPGQSFTSVIHYPSANIVTLVATVTVKKPTVPIFQCKTAFEIIGTSSFYNLTVPQVNFLVGNTIVLDVQYYPNITSITSTVSTTDNCVYKQESLTCAADANPPAQYEWLDLSNNVKTIGSVISISSGGQYQCIAYNVIRSVKTNDTKIASEATCYSPYNLTIIGSNCPNNSCSCSCNGGNQFLVSLNGMASGFPAPSFHWWSDVPSMEDLGNNSTINVDIDGNYSCTASNVYGSQPHTATASILITNCLARPKTTLSTTTILQSTPVTSSDACSCEQITTTSKNSSVNIKLWAAIVLGVLLFISLVTNGIQLILLIMNKRTKRDDDKSTENILQPGMLDLSPETQTPTTYEEFRRPTENNLQLSTYEELRHKPTIDTNQ